MADENDTLRDDLEAAYGADLPGERFTARVMDRVDSPGGRVEEIAVPEPTSRRPLLWLGAGVAAAAVLVVAALGLRIVGGAGPDREAERLAAPPGPVELPPSDSAEEAKDEASIVIHLSADGTIRMDGKVMDLTVLKKSLAARAEAHRLPGPGRPSGVSVRIRTDRRVPWKHVQWIMQACADPDVRIFRIGFAATRADREAEIPVPLPLDRGLLPTRPEPPRLVVRLVRKDGDAATRLEAMGKDLGRGERAWADLATAIRKARGELPAAPTLDASRAVPYEEVVKAIDLLRGAGYEEIRFVGTPPPESERDAKPARTRLTAVLRREGGRTILEQPGASSGDLEIGIGLFAARLKALRDAGLARPVTIVRHPGVPDGDVRRLIDALREVRAKVEILVEEPD